MVSFSKSRLSTMRIEAGKRDYDYAPLLVTGLTFYENVEWEFKLRKNDLKFLHEFFQAQTDNPHLRFVR